MLIPVFGKVSIPHWFFPKLLMNLHESSITLKFPYHIGSFQTCDNEELSAWYITLSFHTTLVLSKRYTRRHCTHHFLVSIPHWFFPNLFWHAYACHFFMVSIPHWFFPNRELLKLARKELKFPYHIGSFQTNVQRKSNNRKSRVSIPHWFFPNTAWLSFLDGENKFPYHIGSFQTPKIL
ncbi:MAG: hypothetical protein PWQ27_1549 [Kosmotoga sp.]|nr:hypothetical protein [Kosmotoga sp.]